jgi:pre-mRNA-splicing helicase BRR2
MAGSPETSAILDMLRATRTSARDRQSAIERTIREEARKLKQGEEGAVGGAPAEKGSGGPGGPTQRQMVDFETLSFSQGSHFRSNKTISLPAGSTK